VFDRHCGRQRVFAMKPTPTPPAGPLASTSPPARRVARPHRLGSARGAHLLVALLATVLLAIALGGYWYHRQQ
jgi:hypothetical protein